MPEFPLFQHHKGIGNYKTCPPSNWNLLKEDISLPALVLDNEKLQQNLAWMEKFLQKFEKPLLLAPHGKTSMIPKIFEEVCKQPKTWGITLATPTQVKVAHDFGVTKVIMANQLVGKRNMEIIAEILEKDENFEFSCLVDSAENVEELGKFFIGRKLILKVLLEYGCTKGRTGVRNEEQENQVLLALSKWEDSLKLVGVEFFEGVLQNEGEVKSFLDFVLDRTEKLARRNVFDGKSPLIISGSGSAWFDIVAEKLDNFCAKNTTIPSKIILRPGCYMFHDVGLYNDISKRIHSSKLMEGEGGLKPALKIWAYVQSIPEADLAILGFGKRDGANDCGFPKPSLHFRPSDGNLMPQPAFEKWEIFKMMDQHSFMRIEDGNDVKIGDMLGLDIAHPCTTLDKWRKVLVVDNEKEYNIVEVFSTFF